MEHARLTLQSAAFSLRISVTPTRGDSQVTRFYRRETRIETKRHPPIIPHRTERVSRFNKPLSLSFSLSLSSDLESHRDVGNDSGKKARRTSHRSDGEKMNQNDEIRSRSITIPTASGALSPPSLSLSLALSRR